jgi:hypothetical protein
MWKELAMTCSRLPRSYTFALIIVGALLLAAACSKDQTPQPAAQSSAAATPAAQTQPSAPAASQAPSPDPAQTNAPAAQPAATAGAAGATAIEKHKVIITNYAGTDVTVSVNGNWVGQWNATATAPLDQVLKGKNQLTVELQDTPKAVLNIEVFAKRDNDDVNLLRLQFQGKQKGTYNYTFYAR